MSKTEQMPLALRCVAWLFVVGGLISIFNLIHSALLGDFSHDVGWIGLVVGPGLLACRPWARKFAIVLFALVIAGLSASAGALLLPVPGFHVEVLGARWGAGGSLFDRPGLAVLLLWLFSVWQFRLLSRPSVVATFTECTYQQWGAADRTSR